MTNAEWRREQDRKTRDLHLHNHRASLHHAAGCRASHGRRWREGEHYWLGRAASERRLFRVWSRIAAV